MEKLIEQVKQWGIERGIDKCDTLMQTTKTLEEVIELQQAILNDDLIEIKDAIGDIFVTLVMLQLQDERVKINLNERNCINEIVFEESTSLVEHVSSLQFYLHNYLEDDKECDLEDAVDSIINSIKGIAEIYNVSLKECVEYAYNEISNRKGKIVDGLFIKESDL